MKTEDYNAQEIFYESRRFLVPIYQRKYQWDDAQLDPFWNDVEMKAVELIEDGKGFKHYMGALILLPEVESSSQIGLTPKVQVVDGQQRLTTFQLFLAAIREIARKHNVIEIAEQIDDYLFNKPKRLDSDRRLARYKLSPTPDDREVFHYILDHSQQEVWHYFYNFYIGYRVPKNTPYRALRAYQVFCGKIDTFVHYETTNTNPAHENESIIHYELPEMDDTALARSRLEALLKALLEQMKLVVITLDEGDDPQIIFETLNSKGRPLLTMDLVRNNIFHRAEKENANTDELFQKLWLPFHGSWWDEPSQFSRPQRPRIDHFLHHVLTAETGRKISLRELYSEYRAFAVPKGKQRYSSVHDELRGLEKFVSTYETLELKTEDDDDLVWIGKKLGAWQVTTAYPIVMQISISDLDSSEKNHLYLLLYSYIVRRTLIGLSNKNFNKIFQSLAREFVENGVSLAVFKSFFSSKEGESSVFPTDEKFRRGIMREPAYQLAPGKRIRDVLWELELATRTSFSEQTNMPEQLWTEHVLPQHWTDEWPFASDGTSYSNLDENPADVRDTMLHTIGNLTLITDMLNISLGNKNFRTKKKELEVHSGLFLNRWFLDKDSWTEIDIYERSKHLASMAVEIWPPL